IPNGVARGALSRRAPEDARYWLAVSQRIAPLGSEAEYLLAVALRKEGQFGEAERHLQRARELGYAEDAVQREAWRLTARQGRLRDVIARLPELLRDAPEEGHDTCEAFILGIIKAKNYFREAHDLLAIWMRDESSDAVPHYLLGVVCVETHDPSRAEKEFREALSRDANHTRAAFALARLLHDQGGIDEASALLDRAAADPELRRDALVLKGRCLRAAGRSDEAVAILDGLLSEDVNDAASTAARTVRAQVDLDASRFEDARDRLQIALRAEPRSAEICDGLATAFRGLNEEEASRRIAAAASDFRAQGHRAVELIQSYLRDPSNADLRFQIGRAHLLFGDHQAGLDWLFGLLEFAPDHRPTLELLATYFEEKADQTPEEWQLGRKFRRHLEQTP
ncbi:MAG: tetratricopeptide repeat protein, partial [Planctomycetes bacterium]|nr:tetratricopeptide repeat protein [Planctomycetota bacterium]